MRFRQTLIVFSKTPKICRVKTRMHPNLTHRECLNFHTQSVRHLLKKLKRQCRFRTILYVTYPANSAFKQTKLQNGKDIGIRMFNALTQELKKSSRVVLIGSDCLQIDLNYILNAFDHLKQSRNNVVLGPADDGGYFLIGCTKINKQYFQNIDWSTNKVLHQTSERIIQSGSIPIYLDRLVDVDTYEDLLKLRNNDKLPEWAQRYIKKN